MLLVCHPIELSEWELGRVRHLLTFIGAANPVVDAVEEAIQTVVYMREAFNVHS